MSASAEGDGLPSLLVQAARTAAEADGLVAAEKAAAEPKDAVAEKAKPDENASAAAVLTSIGSSAEKKNEAAAAAAMDRARSAVAAATSAPAAAAGKTPPSAGTAAHMMASQAPPPVRKSPAVAAAAQASSPMPTSSSSKKKGPPLRRGKWTPEEEAYANRLIMEFKAGLLPLTDGTTLRTFLSKLLNCDPMRISKKFVGSNCIGKQVFRRRTADINRLTPEQIQQSRAELSELERRFLERVAQTNRVKSSGVGGSGGGGSSNVGAGSAVDGKLKDDMGDNAPPSPPWLQPPLGYKQGTGAAMAAAALAGGGANSRAAAAGRALLQGVGAGLDGGKSSKLQSHGSAGLLAMAELQRRSQQNLLQSAMGNRSSASNLLAAAVAGGGGAGSGLSSSAMAQIARNASAARLAGLTAAGNSVNNLMLKTGLSRDQLTQLAREQGMASSASLSNMMERQSSFDALMSLDFQSLQSIDNLANLIQTSSGLPGQHVPETGMKNWSADGGQASAAAGSSGNLSGLASMRRLASAGRMESLLRSLSSGNVNKSSSASSAGGGSSNANFNNLLQSVQSNLGGAGASANNLLGANAASALSLANMFRPDSSTGLTALRMQDGLVQRNSSVDDFLSLVTSGDIPHQDPSLLNVPLMQQQQQQATAGNQSGAQAAATYLAQQQLLAQAANSGNAALQSALARGGSLGNLRNASAASLGQQGAATAAAALQQRAAALGLATVRHGEGGGPSSKRKLADLAGEVDDQGSRKR